MRTLGIDLAAQPENTAACVIEWDDRRGAVVRLDKGIDDAALLAAMKEADWTGIDAPFGWPEDFLAATSRFAEDGTWPATTEKDRLRYRATDRWVRDNVKVNPLSVSSDRIAVCAWRCAQLLAAHSGRSEGPFDRLGGERLVEVYPAAALKRWGFERDSYKKGGKGETRQSLARRAILERLSELLPALSLDPRHADACVGDDDQLDALVCALVTRAAATGSTAAPPSEPVVAREGWIHVPEPGSLAGLVG